MVWLAKHEVIKLKYSVSRLKTLRSLHDKGLIWFRWEGNTLICGKINNVVDIEALKLRAQIEMNQNIGILDLHIAGITAFAKGDVEFFPHELARALAKFYTCYHAVRLEQAADLQCSILEKEI